MKNILDRNENIFERNEAEIELRSNEDWALLSLESEEDEDNVEKENVEEEEKWRSTIDKLKTIVKVRMHKKEMCKTNTTKKEDRGSNGVDHDEIGKMVGFHFEKEFARFELKKTKVDFRDI